MIQVVKVVTKLLTSPYGDVLKHRTFRWFWLGLAVSSVGDAMSDIAIIWLAMELLPEQRAFAIALATSSYLAPGVITGMALGNKLNRLSGYRLIQIDNVNRFICLAAISGLQIAGWLSLPLLVGLLCIASLSRPFGGSGERVYTKRIIPVDKLFAANSLVGISVQSSYIVGPILAGILIQKVSATITLGIDSLTFAAFALVMVFAPRDSSNKQEINEDISPKPKSLSVWNVGKGILILFSITFLFHLLYGPLVVALPLVTEEISNEAATLYGILWSAFGIGALLGSFIAGFSQVLTRYATTIIIVMLWGTTTIVLGIATSEIVLISAMAIGGFVYAPYPALTATLIQRDVSEAFLAQVSSYWSSMTSIASPLGTLLAGLVITIVTPQTSLILSGSLMILVSLIGLLIVRVVGDLGRPSELPSTVK